MTFDQITVALRREQELLEQLSILAEQQLGLLHSGDLDSFGVIWPLRAEPMNELMRLEDAVSRSLDELQSNKSLSWRERREIRGLNQRISEIAGRITAMDEQTLVCAQIESLETLSRR
jgi:hypothetical protein